MTVASTAAFVLGITLNAIYLALAVNAHSHVKQEKTSRMMPGLIALTLWWPFYDIYDDAMTKRKVWGLIMLPIIVGAYIAAEMLN